MCGLDNIYTIATKDRYKGRMLLDLHSRSVLKDFKASLQTSALISPHHFTGSSTVFGPCTKLLTILLTSISDEK